jgi:vancomycin aglycone glucosyltransferase
MRFLLSTIGSRGDVQPLVALASELRALGEDVHLCVPPDFREWIEGLGMPVTPIGPELRSMGKARPVAGITPEQRRQMIEGTVAAQFQTISAAARDRDAIVGATALQIAAPSVAEGMGIPYVFAAYCPTVLPSKHHAPPVLVSLGDTAPLAVEDYSQHWARDTQRWNDAWRPPLNAQREVLGLAPIDDVRGHVLTNRPWLAADATLGPWPDPADANVFQTGAWILPDHRPLTPEIEAFLDAGDPPVYFGFGSVGAPENISRVMIESARAVGRRSIVLRGWAELPLIDDAADCLSIGEVNQQMLFKRVAAVVHHGGAGTTTAAARAGAPQVVIAQHYDQPYWAHRVHQLGIGTALASATPSVESLTSALARTLEPIVATQARSVAAEMRGDGASIAARRLIDEAVGDPGAG